jgi:small GTP-binding protein
MNSLHDLPPSKIVLLGDSGVGKTSIVQYFERRRFDPTIDSTIGAAFVAHEVTTKTGPINLHIWDTAGQERYRSLVPTYSRGASCALIVFDQSVLVTFQNADQWLSEFASFGNDHCIMCLVANKTDLASAVDRLQVESWAEQRKLRLFFVSAKSGVGVVEMFQEIADELAESQPIVSQQFDQVPSGETDNEKAGVCC